MRAAAPIADGNPSSVHTPGRRARAALGEARAKIARCLGASPAEIVFTSSGSEANNLALKGTALRDPGEPFHLIVSAIEHDSVRFAARYLAERFDWVHLSEVAPDSGGLIAPEEIERVGADGASLVSVMAVNNETGVRQPIAEIAAVAHRLGALMHTDAVQGLGRIDLDVREMGCDLLTASAHKVYGPRATGLLYVRAGTRVDALVHGGHQEKGRRAGTENLESVVGFAEAVTLASGRLAETNLHLADLERTFLERLRSREVSFEINGSCAQKVAGVLNISLEGTSSDDLVVGMDLAGFALSAGAACSSGVIEPSHVLQAMDLESWRIAGGIRISFGRTNTPREAVAAADGLADLHGRLKKERSRALESSS